jgi:hypothetical protein
LYAALDVQLPWVGLKQEVEKDREAHIQLRKEAVEDPDTFWAARKKQLGTLPKEIKTFSDAVAKLGPDEVPNYEELANVLRETNEMPPKFYTLIHTACVKMKNVRHL